MNHTTKQIEFQGKIHNLPWLKLSEPEIRIYGIMMQEYYAVKENRINLVEGK